MRRPMLAASVVGATLAMAAPAAEAAPGDPIAGSTCNSSALLQPLLVPPSCVTELLQCPEQLLSCQFDVTATAASAIGAAGMRLTFEALVDGQTYPLAAGSCAAANSCTVESGALVSSAMQVRARCNWETGLALAIQPRVECSASLLERQIG